MVFVPPPDATLSLLDLSLPKVLLGSKEGATTAWRVLTDVFTGKTKRPQQKTVEMISGLISAKFPNGSIPDDLFEIAKQFPADRPWASTVASLNAGLARASAKPMAIFGTEADRLEQIANVARTEIRQGRLNNALDHVGEWGINEIPCFQWTMEQIDRSGPVERFVATASPLVIASTLYLFACWNIDEYGKSPPDNAVSILPEERKGQLVRPMTRWLEAFKPVCGLPTKKAVRDYLLNPDETHEDVETLKRLFRKWWNEGEIPSQSRVPHMVNSIGRAHKEVDYEEIRLDISFILGKIRFLDALLNLSQGIQAKLLPNYNPLSPFRDYPLMSAQARKRKAALSP